MRRYFCSLGVRLLDRVRPFWRNECAAVAIYVGITSVVMIGFGALVIDLGRLMTVNTELQNAADAAALAGAAELNGDTDSITRATKAAENNLITNKESLYTTGGSSTVGIAKVCFFSSLPSSDSDPLDCNSSYVTTNPTQARFISVTVDTRRVDYLLAGVLKVALGGAGKGVTGGDTNAVAVAGNNSVVCKVPPLMICNPTENSAGGGPFTAPPGEQILLKFLGSTSQWTQGGFGLLVPPSGNSGANAIAQYIASGDSNGCYSTDVSIDTGQKQVKVQDAMNVRFDMYGNGLSNTNSSYEPAPNVTKGEYLSGNQWTNYTPPTGIAMPVAPCFASTGGRICPDPMSINPGATDSVGDNNYAGTSATTDPGLLTQYWSINHPTKSLDLGDIADYSGLHPGSPDALTMYDLYRYEIDNGIPDNANGGSSTSAGENGKPTNYQGSTAANADRRTIQLAVLNCIADGINGASGGPYPVIAFVNMFLIRPAEDPSSGGIYAEVMKVLVPGQDDELHDIVQLYR